MSFSPQNSSPHLLLNIRSIIRVKVKHNPAAAGLGWADVGIQGLCPKCAGRLTQRTWQGLEKGVGLDSVGPDQDG